MNNSKALVVQERQVPSAEAMGQMLAVAKSLVDAGMVPVGIKTPGQALALILTGREFGIGPLRSVQDLYAVSGNVGMTTKFMVAQFRLAGHNHHVVVRTPQHCKVILHLKGGRDVTCELSREEVDRLRYSQKWDDKKHEWVVKGQWKIDPAGMLYNRAMTRAIRTHTPEVLYGLVTNEEIEDQAVAAGESHLVAFLKENHPEVWVEYENGVVQPAPEAASEPAASNSVVEGEARELQPEPEGGQPSGDRQTEPGTTSQSEPHWINRYTKDGRSIRDIFWNWVHEKETLTDEQVYEALGTRNEVEFPPMEETKNRIHVYILQQTALDHEAKAKNGQPVVQERIPFL